MQDNGAVPTPFEVLSNRLDQRLFPNIWAGSAFPLLNGVATCQKGVPLRPSSLPFGTFIVGVDKYFLVPAMFHFTYS